MNPEKEKTPQQGGQNQPGQQQQGGQPQPGQEQQGGGTPNPGQQQQEQPGRRTPTEEEDKSRSM